MTLILKVSTQLKLVHHSFIISYQFWFPYLQSKKKHFLKLNQTLAPCIYRKMIKVKQNLMKNCSLRSNVMKKLCYPKIVFPKKYSASKSRNIFLLFDEPKKNNLLYIFFRNQPFISIKMSTWNVVTFHNVCYNWFWKTQVVINDLPLWLLESFLWSFFSCVNWDILSS